MKIQMPPPILVTGCARSGTSLISGIINISGAFGGIMSGKTPYNQKGMFENHNIRQNIVKPYLKKIGCDPKGQNPLPDTKDLYIPTNWKAQVEQVFIDQGYEHGPWFYKGAKMCLFWPVWNFAFPNAKWIIVRRKDHDIVNSCMKTSFMNAYPDPEGWHAWVDHHKEKFVEMVEEGLNIKQIWPERMVTGDYSQIYETIEWLGLDWDAGKVQEFIEPKLWKAKRKKGIV